MRMSIAAGTRAILLGLALLCAVSGPPAAAQDESGMVHAAEDPSAEASDAEISEAHRRFDLYARTLSKKKRSELINLKTYSDEEWAQHERAVKAHNAACRKGDAAACLGAGRAYAEGDGVWTVPAIAYILYGEACDQGLGEACRAYASLAKTGYGYPEGGVAAAEAMLEKSCTSDDAESCADLAAELWEVDKARADAFYDKACKLGWRDACVAFGRWLIVSEAPGDYDRGLAILEGACSADAAQACHVFASELESRPDHDPAQVSGYRERACNAGHAEACSEQGRREWAGAAPLSPGHERAIGYYAKACAIEDYRCAIPRSLAALPALETACAAGQVQGCADLGRQLLLAGSPAEDPERGIDLLVAACRNGLSNACGDAAEAAGIHRGSDQALIGEMLEQGCAANDPAACLGLARSLSSEPDTPQLERAVALYRQLCDAGNAAACEAEADYAGIVAGARIPAADDLFTAPLPTDEATALRQATEIREICFSGSERFRGKTYQHFACERSEKGIGSDRARPGQAPWQALLWRPARMFGDELKPAQRVKCGGSLIAQGWILTAAHCLNDEGIDLTDPAARADYRIRLGVFNPALDEGVSYPIKRVIPHPQFNPLSRYEFDIALIEYSTVASRPGKQGAFVHPVRTISLDPLPVSQRRIIAGTPVYAFGWGWTAEQKSAATDYLQIVEMQLSSDRACAAATGFAKAFVTAAVCAKGRNNEQTCYGDSGGPLVHYGGPGGRPVLIGVVSGGEKCGTGPTKRPSQYTRVARVRDWIAAHVPGVR
jgi:TPR repeat protein